MKRIILILGLTFSLGTTWTSVSDTIEGLLTQVVNSGGLTSYYNAPFVITSLMYTPGGITFSFPTGFFVETPYVFVSLIYQGASDTMSRYDYVAYNRSETGITIMVYDTVTGLEVSSSSLIEVDIFATAADPNGSSILVSGGAAMLL